MPFCHLHWGFKFVNVKRVTYQSYLLRLWRSEVGQECRASLQSTTDRTVHHFANMDALFIFLQEHTSVILPPNDSPDLPREDDHNETQR
jgi:hypothetical protein